MQDEERAFPLLNAAGEEDELQTIRPSETRSFHLALKDDQLLSQGSVVGDELGFTSWQISCDAEYHRITGRLSEMEENSFERYGEAVEKVQHKQDPWMDYQNLSGNPIPDAIWCKCECGWGFRLGHFLFAIRSALACSPRQSVKNWKDALLIVKPDTLLLWHRQGFRLFWKFKSRHCGGHPSLDVETVAMIRQMAQENRWWGAERIRGELLKLGVTVAKHTIQKYVARVRSDQPGSQTWATFLKTHAKEI